MKKKWYKNWKVLVPIFAAALAALIAGLFATFNTWFKYKLDSIDTSEFTLPSSQTETVQENNFIHPKQPNYEYNLGMIAYERGEYEQALEQFLKSAKAYEQVDRFSYDHATALLNVGLACDYLARYEEALLYCDQARAIWENDYEEHEQEIAWVLDSIGGIYSKQGKLDDALRMYRNALDIGRVDKVGKEAIEIGASTSAAIMMTLLETRRKTWYNWMVKSR